MEMEVLDKGDESTEEKAGDGKPSRKASAGGDMSANEILKFLNC